MNSLPELPTIEVRIRVAQAEALKSFESMLLDGDVLDSYNNLRHIFRVALSSQDYKTPIHVESLTMFYDLLDTMQQVINPQIKTTVSLQ